MGLMNGFGLKTGGASVVAAKDSVRARQDSARHNPKRSASPLPPDGAACARLPGYQKIMEEEFLFHLPT